MENKPIQPISTLFGHIYQKKGATSERADLIQQLSDVTGIKFKLLLKNTFHLKEEWGVKILRMILDDTLSYSSEREWRRFKCAELINKSKVKK